MPCSRSARRPSVKSEKSIGPALRFFDAFSTEVTWSSYTDCESYSSRPMSVLFPSSTLPAVQMRRRPLSTLEVSLTLLQLHRAVLIVIDDAQLALGLPSGNQLLDDLRNGIGIGPDGAGARRAAERSHAALDDLRLLAGHRDDKRLFLDDQRVAPDDDLAFLREIERHDGDLFHVDVLPHVELGPVREREDADAFARPKLRVEQARSEE